MGTDLQRFGNVQSRLITAWFGASKFCSTTVLWEAIQRKGYQRWCSATYDMGFVLARS